jgi:hypothetical protein
VGLAMRIAWTRVVERIFELKADGSRVREGPKLRCLEDIENDLPELRLKAWRLKGNIREKWSPFVKEAKVCRDP